MTETAFTEQLRARHGTLWDEAVGHRFVRELADGTIPDEVMAGYLVQDYRFLDGFLALLGAAVATADTLEARLRLGRFIGELSGEENSYFLRAFDALGVSETMREATPDTDAAAAFVALFREAAAERSYAAALAVLAVAEWLYLDWAMRVPRPLPERFVHAEWVTLHDSPGFRDLVAFLRAELDRVGPAEAELADELFGRAVALERDFFDASYAQPLEGLR